MWCHINYSRFKCITRSTSTRNRAVIPENRHLFISLSNYPFSYFNRDTIKLYLSSRPVRKKKARKNQSNEEQNEINQRSSPHTLINSQRIREPHLRDALRIRCLSRVQSVTALVYNGVHKNKCRTARSSARRSHVPGSPCSLDLHARIHGQINGTEGKWRNTRGGKGDF